MTHFLYLLQSQGILAMKKMEYFGTLANPRKICNFDIILVMLSIGRHDVKEAHFWALMLNM